jgi:hypothetical protein
MATRTQLPAPVPIRACRRDGLVKPHAIRLLARVIAERFTPEKIILRLLRV